MRRKLDQYFTPKFATCALLHFHPEIATRTRVFECCSGTDDIATELRKSGAEVLTNDIDPLMPADWHLDATSEGPWSEPYDFEWVVSNPPFNVCQPIIQHAYQKATVGVAMLLRLSYLEPCLNRAEWLKSNPINHLIVLPRISFTNDGKTDNVTVAWLVWSKTVKAQSISIVTRDDAKEWSGLIQESKKC